MVLGYLVAGVIIGPGILALVGGSNSVQNIAELGVVFLLFTVGLELNVNRLRLIRNQIFGLGTAQVVLTTLVIALIAWGAGLTVEAAVIVGAGLALSSTSASSPRTRCCFSAWSSG
ncbi:MAG: cation:proton antiporter [Alphaproteobacteria bacterium]